MRREGGWCGTARTQQRTRTRNDKRTLIHSCSPGGVSCCCALFRLHWYTAELHPRKRRGSSALRPRRHPMRKSSSFAAIVDDVTNGLKPPDAVPFVGCVSQNNSKPSWRFTDRRSLFLLLHAAWWWHLPAMARCVASPARWQTVPILA